MTEAISDKEHTQIPRVSSVNPEAEDLQIHKVLQDIAVTEAINDLQAIVKHLVLVDTAVTGAQGIDLTQEGMKEWVIQDGKHMIEIHQDQVKDGRDQEIIEKKETWIERGIIMIGESLKNMDHEEEHRVKVVEGTILNIVI